MTRSHLFLLGVLCLLTAPARAGLFNDDKAREQIRELEARIASLETVIEQLDALTKQQAATIKQQTNAMLDIQTSLEAQTAEMRRLRGLNEELAHNLQDAEKRQKDLYVDLDGRLRRFEAGDAVTVEKVTGKKAKTDDPTTENRALEAAYGFYKIERYQNAVTAFQEFLTNYPQSPHAGNIRYWLGNAYFVLKDYKASMENYQILVSKFDTHPKIVEAMFGIADCQELLRDKEGAKQTLKQIVAKFANSEAAAKAKKHITTLK